MPGVVFHLLMALDDLSSMSNTTFGQSEKISQASLPWDVIKSYELLLLPGNRVTAIKSGVILKIPSMKIKSGEWCREERAAEMVRRQGAALPPAGSTSRLTGSV